MHAKYAPSLPRVTQDQHSEISGSRIQCYYSTLTPTHFHKAPHSWSSFEHVRGTGNSSCFRQHLMGQTPLTRTCRTGRPDPVPTESRSAARPAFPPLSPPQRKDECACVSRNMGALWPSSPPLYGCVCDGFGVALQCMPFTMPYFRESWETGLSGQNAGSENGSVRRCREGSSPCFFVCRKIGQRERKTEKLSVELNPQCLDIVEV